MTKRFVRRAQHRQACLLGIVYNIMCAHTHSHKSIILHTRVQATSSVGSISLTDCKCNPGYTYVLTPLSCPHLRLCHWLTGGAFTKCGGGTESCIAS